MYTSAVLLYYNGVLSVRPAVRGPQGREGDPSLPLPRLGQANHLRHELPTLAQNYTQGPQIT